MFASRLPGTSLPGSPPARAASAAFARRQRSGLRCCTVALMAVMAVAACQRETPSATPAVATGPASAATSPPPLQDVIERDPRYLIGISYPPVARDYPRLAAALQQYANAARAELMQAVEGLGAQTPPAPYDLSLSFSQLALTPQLIVVAADGSSYTGGAHGNPLLARFVWLRQSDQPLTATMLVPDPQAWRDISAYVREQLYAALSQRIDADALPPAERADLAKNAGRMIDDGTAPDPRNFAQFEPVFGDGGKIAALRFVFAPYQVGPYSDGVQTVDVPADVLLPGIAPQYRALFSGGQGR